MQYSFKCKKCMKSFVVDFSSGSRLKKEEKPVTVKKPILEITEKKEKPPAINNNITVKAENNIPVMKSEPVQKESGIHIKGKTFSDLNLKEIFSIAFTAFSPQKLLISSLAVVAIALLLFAYNSMESLIFTSRAMKEYGDMRIFFNIFPLAIVFFVFILASSLVSKITIEKIFFNRIPELSHSLVFAARIMAPVFICNVLILLLLNTVLVLFGKIPLVGPVVFSLLFLPVYVISFVILVVVFLGFWFYPPMVAFRNTGIAENMGNFYHFIKKHNFVLLYVIPIMAISEIIIFSGIYLLHYGSLSISIFFIRGISGENMGKLFSSLPPPLLRIAEPSLFGTDIGFFKSLMGGLSSAHHAGGAILGFVMAFISVLLFGIFISITATLSTHVYIMMERGIDIDDAKKGRLLFLLVMMLLGIFLMKMLVGRL